MRSHNVRAKRSRVAATLLFVATPVLTGAPAVSGEQGGDLAQQIEQLRQEYEQQIRDLQRRLAALERKSAQQEAQATPAEKYSVSAQQAVQQLTKPPQPNAEQNEARLQAQT